MAQQGFSAKRFNLVIFGISGFFALAAYGQVRVNGFQRRSILDYATESDRFIVTRIDKAKRGQILSSDGKVLAQDDDTFQLGVKFEDVPISDAFYTALASASGIPASEFEYLAQSGASRKFWINPISSSQAKAIGEVKRDWRADGVSVSRAGRRAYPLGEAAAGVTGMVRGDAAVAGIEKSKDTLLQGVDGKTVGLVDKKGAFLPMRLTEMTRDKDDGQPLTLTIDSELQIAATEALRAAVEKNRAERGAVIIMDPKTGDILAMANWPTYDPNLIGRTLGATSEGSSDFNMNLMGIYEPGSTFKILTLAKALEEGVVDPLHKIHCTGELDYNSSWRIRCDNHHGNRAHGDVDAEAAIARSCNVSAATWALAVGEAKFVHYIEDLGLLRRTELGLPGERNGLFNYKEYAKPLQLMNLGFGQSLSSTPIALADAFAMLGNGGVRMKPRLIKRIGNHEEPPQEVGRMVSPETAQKVMSLMESVIEKDMGTGAKLRIPGYRLAGKTGTAQKIGGEKNGGHVSNFVGYVPAENPRAMILTMIDNPQGGTVYGAAVAGPVFVDLAAQCIRRLAIPRSSSASIGESTYAVHVKTSSGPELKVSVKPVGPVGKK